MDKSKIIEKIVAAVTQIQETSGRVVGPYGPGTRPFTDVEGFDSLNGVEATVIISESLSRDLPESIFLAKDGHRRLSIGEIANSLCEIMGVEPRN